MPAGGKAFNSTVRSATEKSEGPKKKGADSHRRPEGAYQPRASAQRNDPSLTSWPHTYATLTLPESSYRWQICGGHIELQVYPSARGQYFSQNQFAKQAQRARAGTDCIAAFRPGRSHRIEYGRGHDSRDCQLCHRLLKLHGID